jgi:hypothetical protein
MPTSPPPPDPDAELLAEAASRLAEVLGAAIPGWVERCVEARAGDRAPGLGPAAVEAGRAASAELGSRIRDLLDRDIDDQPTTPLALLRGAVRYPTEILAGADIPPVRRDREAERLFPDDVYDLTPAAFGDFGPDAHEAGLVWGAAKAKVHLGRRRPTEGPER